MRRTVVVLIFSIFILGAFAAPALAQLRDPFDPLVSTDGTVEPGAQPDDGTPPEVVVPPDRSEQGLPNTGQDSNTWMVLAYGLICAGATALVVARSRRPITLR